MNPAINQRGTTSRAQVLTTIGFALVILVPSLLGFANKFREFILLYRGDVDGVFAITPIMNYLLASLGFFCLFFWAIYQGMFRDIEAPKFTMLENERRLDRRGLSTSQEHPGETGEEDRAIMAHHEHHPSQPSEHSTTGDPTAMADEPARRRRRRAV